MSSTSSSSSSSYTPFIVSVGSSFAAGPGLEPVENAAAGRSKRNFAHLLHESLPGSRLLDLTVSGATLLNVLKDEQDAGKETFPPQITRVPSDADLILLTCGGNDLSYIGGMFHDAAPWILRKLLFPPLPSPVSEAELHSRFLDTVDALHAKAPKARIILCEYPQLLGPPEVTVPGRDVNMTREQIDKHRAKCVTLQRTYAKVAAERSTFCERIPVHTRSEGHELGTEQPWTYGFNLGLLYRMCAFHPNYDGMQAIAEILHRYLQGGQP